MKFETSQSKPFHLNRRLELRMLSFVAMFGVVMFLANVVFNDATQDQTSGTTRRAVTPDRDVFEVRDDGSRPLKDDEFIALPGDEFAPPIERSREWLDEQAARGEEWAVDAAARDREQARRNIRFDKRWLTKVKDNTVGIRRDEADAYFRLLDHVRHVPQADLDRAAAPDVLYINLMTEPERFRGEPITIQGELWRLYEFEAGPNQAGLTRLYEAWIFTGDSGTHPYRVVTPNLPHNLTPGENIRKPVRVTGYFLKREGYASQGGMHVAPTLIAPTLATYRPSSSIPPTDAIVPYMVGVVTAVGLALLVTLLAFTLGDRRVKRQARERALHEPRPSFAGLDAGPMISVEESLRQFAEQERQSDLRDEIAASGQSAGSVATSVLYRRDPEATVPPPVPSPSSQGDELDSRPLAQAGVLQDWASRRSLADEGHQSGSHQNGAQRSREQHETERVLNDLDPATIRAGEGPESEHDEFDGTVFTRRSSAQDFSRTENADETAADQVGESKLAEWEREIQQFADRGPSPVDDQRAARDQLRRDRLARDQELRDTLQQQHIESEVARQSELEQERDTLDQAAWNDARRQAEREREPRSAADDDLDDAGGEDESRMNHLVFDRAERPLPDNSQTEDDSADEESGDKANGSSKSPGWAKYNEQRARRRRDHHRRGGR